MNIIVTGASKGIGFELVKKFASNGNHIIVAISRNSFLLNQLKNECVIINPNAKVFPIGFDLTSTEIKNILLPKILSCISNVDILINNAGYLVNKPINQTTEEDLQSVFAANYFSVYHLIKHLIPVFNKEISHIVNISSMGGVQSSAKFVGLSAYSASKAALCNLTETFAEELKDKNIRVNCLALGAVQTEMLNNAFPGYKAQISAEEMAEFIANFTLTASKTMNGKIIPVSISTP
ncbi:MAG: SDR family oxidoreductase [Bacteroidota bacterium]